MSTNRLQAMVSPLPAIPIAVLHPSQQARPWHPARPDACRRLDARGLLAAADGSATPSGEGHPRRGHGATASVHASPATNLVDLRIGTPSLTLTDVLETGSNGA